MPFDVYQLTAKLFNMPAPTAYSSWVSVFKRMSEHMRGRVPDTLCKRRPNEIPEITNYRTENFRAITKKSIGKGVDNLHRLFQSCNWTFTASVALMKYLQEAKFKKHTLRGYLERFVLRFDIEDPNGILIWMPTVKDIDYNGTVDFSIEPKLFNSRRIYAVGEDYICLAEGKTEFSPTQKPKSDSYLIASTKGFFRWYRDTTKNTNVWLVDELWLQDFSYAPWIVLGGETTTTDVQHTTVAVQTVEADYFESFFDAFLPFADEAHGQFTDHQAVNVQFAFPLRTEVQLDCDADNCDKGQVPLPTVENPDNTVACRRCGGSGKLAPRSPYGVYRRQPQAFTNPDGTANNTPMVELLSADPAIMDYSDKQWQTMLEKAEDALNLIHIYEPQSGVAKEIDREGLYAMLLKIGNNFFDNIVWNSLWHIENLISASPIAPVVNKPVSYEIKTEEMVMKEITTLSGSGLPKWLIAAKMQMLLQKSFNEGDPIHKMVFVLEELDPFMYYTQQERERLSALGLITNEMFINGLYGPLVLRKFQRQQPEQFSNMNVQQLVAKVEAELKPFYQKIKVFQPTNPDGTPAKA